MSRLLFLGNKIRDYVLRRCTQTTKEGDDPRIRSHRSQGPVFLFHQVVQFRQPFSRPPFAMDVRADLFSPVAGRQVERCRLQCRIGTSCGYRYTSLAQQCNARCVCWVSRDELRKVLTDLKPASVQALSITSSGLWKTRTTNSPSHILTWRTFPFLLNVRTSNNRLS